MSTSLPLTPMVRIRAAAMWLPSGAAITGRSAARLWGVELGDDDAPVEVLCPTRLRRVPGVIARTSRVEPDEMANHRGIAVTTPSHTAWEIGRSLPEWDAIGWLDALARRRRLTTPVLRAEADRHRGEAGSRRAAATLSIVDARAESPPESRLRVAFAQAGLPVPVPQFSVIVGGFFIARVDFAWPDWRFAVEYDGQWHADRGQLHRDRARLRELNAADWFVFHVTREDMSDISRVVGQIRALLSLRRQAVESRSVIL